MEGHSEKRPPVLKNENRGGIFLRKVADAVGIERSDK
jgi:hypothetical protein